MAQPVNESSLNVAQYAASYQGFTKLARLTFLAESFSSLKTACNRELLKELKGSSNAIMYAKVLHATDEATRRELQCDESLAQSMSQSNQLKMDMLEAELANAKSAMLKEGIRTGHTDIGHLHYQMGSLNEALKSYLRSRDFCTMPRHTIDMCMNVITVSLDLKQYFNVTNFASKVTDTLGDEIVMGKLKVAAAVVDISEAQFKSAAQKFLSVSPSLGNQFNSVVSEQDIALYGAIFALATFDRAELRTQLIENKPFLNAYLNLLPDVKTLAFSFYNGQYGTALATLQAIMPRLQCDMYLHGCVATLIAQIQERMLLQYFAPYCAVDLTRMAQQLQMSPNALEDALVNLISSGKLAARIDAGSNTLQRRERDMRQETIQKVLALSTVHGHAIRRDMLRLSMAQQNFVLGDGDEGEGGARGGGGQGVNLSRQHSGSSMDARDPESVRGDGGGYGDAAMMGDGGYSYGLERSSSGGMLVDGGAYGQGYGYGGNYPEGVHVMSQSAAEEEALAHMLQQQVDEEMSNF